MKKNLIKLGMMSFFVLALAAGVVAYAAGYERQWAGPVTAKTPSWGNVTDVKSAHSGRWYDDSTGTVWTTYQSTTLKHQIRLAYSNISGGLTGASSWATAEVDSIKRPELTYFEMFRAYFSQAKSHNLEPTNNTVVKYKFASYSM